MTPMRPLTHARWRRLVPLLRAELRQVLDGKLDILGHQVLDVMRDLRAREAITGTISTPRSRGR